MYEGGQYFKVRVGLGAAAPQDRLNLLVIR